MTAPDAPQVEPLTLTLEEALQRLYAKGLILIPPGDGTDSWGIGVAGDSPDEEFDTWHEAVSAVEGVPVVPRDEAAELREENHTLRTEADGWLKRVELLEAAIREWVEATSDAEMFELDQSNAYGTDHADAEVRVEAAAQALRRLAGGGES